MQVINKTENNLEIRNSGIKSSIIASVIILALGITFFWGYYIFHSARYSGNLLLLGFACVSLIITLIPIFGRDIILSTDKKTLKVNIKTLFSKKENSYNLLSLQRIDIRGTRGIYYLFLIYATGNSNKVGLFPNNISKIGTELSEFLKVPLYNTSIDYVENAPREIGDK